MKIAYKGFIYEAVNINKEYLLKLAGGDLNKFNEAKKTSESIISSAHIPVSNSDKVKLIPLLCKFILTEGLPDNIASFIHDLAVDNKVNLFFKLNSDSKRVDLDNLMEEYRLSKMSNGDKLSSEDSCIWLRVKLFHDFGDGFKWVIALDGSGDPIGYIPSHITNTTMRHCGNEPSVENGDIYYGLRDSNDKEYVTVIIDVDGNIKESKGYNNSPPKNKAQINKYMQWLMMHPIVKGTSYSNGYARHMNYGVSQMLDDEAFLNKVEKEKPELINPEVDRIILDWRKKLKNGEITVDSLKEMYLDKKLGNDFMFEHLIGIVGKNPFTEAEMVKYINENKLKGIEIGNAGNQYLTIPVQHALVDNSDFRVLTEVYFNVPNNKIDFQYIIDSYSPSDIHNLFNIIPNERKFEILDKYSFEPEVLHRLFYSQYSNVPKAYDEENGGYSADDTEQAKFIRKLMEKGKIPDSIVSSRTGNGRYLIAKDVIEWPNILKIFLEKGLNPNEIVDNKTDETLFNYALSRPSVYLTDASIMEMLKYGAEIQDVSIWEAYSHGLYGRLELLLSHSKNPSRFMTEMYNSSTTLLMRTAMNLQKFEDNRNELIELLDILFKYGSNPNQMGSHNKNCIDFAISKDGNRVNVSTDSVDILSIYIKALLDKGFNLTDELYKKYYDILKEYPYFYEGSYGWREIRDIMNEYI